MNNDLMRFADDNGQLSQIAEVFVLRERELKQYQLNAAHFQVMLSDLPSETDWPDDLQHLRSMTREQIADVVTDEQLQQVAELHFADWCRHMWRTETWEAIKVRRMRDALLSFLPIDRRDELIAAATLRIAERQRITSSGVNITLQLPDHIAAAFMQMLPHATQEQLPSMNGRREEPWHSLK